MTTYDMVKPHHVLPDKLDPSLYKLRDDEKAFYQAATGINDDEELKEHIIAVQTEAYEVLKTMLH